MVYILSDEDHYLPFVCPICMDMVELSAVVTPSCSHLFCKSCLTDWCQESSSCPTCDGNILLGEVTTDRTGLEGVDVVRLSAAQPLAHICLSRVRVCCPDCQVWTGMYSNLSAHREDCPKKQTNNDVASSQRKGRRGLIGHESTDDESASDDIEDKQFFMSPKVKDAYTPDRPLPFGHSKKGMVSSDDDSMPATSTHSHGFRRGRKLGEETANGSRPNRRQSDRSADSGMNSSNNSAVKSILSTSEDADVFNRSRNRASILNRNNRRSSLENNELDDEWHESDHQKSRLKSFPIPMEIKTSANDDYADNNDDINHSKSSRSEMIPDSTRSAGPSERRSRSPVPTKAGLRPIDEAESGKDPLSTSYSRHTAGPVVPAVRPRLRKEHSSAFTRDHDSTSRHFITATTLKDQGNATFNKGDFLDARKLYTDGINAVAGLQPTCQEESHLVAALYCNRGATYLKEKRYQETVNDCEFALKFNPEYPKAYTRKWRGLMALGRFGEAKALLQAGLKLCPGDKILSEDLAKNIKADDDLHEAQRLLGKGDYRGVLAIATQLLTISDGPEVNCLTAKAEAAIGQIDPAMKRIANIMRENPRSPEGLQTKGFAILMAADTEKAVEILQDSVQQDPDNLETKTYLKLARKISKIHTDGRATALKGQFKKAVEIFSLAMDADVPKQSHLNSLLLTERADANLHSGNYAAAVSDSKAAIDIKSDNVRAWVVKANAYIASGKAVEAKRVLKVAKNSWASKNEKIIEAYDKADFEVRIQEADMELRNMIGVPRVKNAPRDDNMVKRRTSISSEAVSLPSLESGDKHRRRTSTIEVASNSRGPNGRGDGDKIRGRRQSTIVTSGSDSRASDGRSSDLRLPDSKPGDSKLGDARGSVEPRDGKGGPPVTRQHGQSRRRTSFGASSPASLDVQDTEDSRTKKIKPMSEADARRRMSMI